MKCLKLLSIPLPPYFVVDICSIYILPMLQDMLNVGDHVKALFKNGGKREDNWSDWCTGVVTSVMLNGKFTSFLSNVSHSFYTTRNRL